MKNSNLNPNPNPNIQSNFTYFKPSVWHDVLELSGQLTDRYSVRTIRVACMVRIVRTLFVSNKLTGTPYGEGMLDLNRECAKAWLEKQGLDSTDLDYALVGLEKAEKTSAYLQSLPD